MKPKTEPFDKHYQQYEDWFDKNEYVYKSELKAVNHFIPKQGRGIEIGIGSGKFAEPLGIKIGVEPSENMRKLAKQRGIKVYDGVGENLQFADKSFDYVLMVTTICFLSDIKKAFKEIRRILKEEGKFIIGFVDRESELGKEYLEKKEDNVFYKNAVFYSAKDVITLLKEMEFKNISTIQTIFGKLSEVKEIQDYKIGYGKGGFVVIKAVK